MCSIEFNEITKSSVDNIVDCCEALGRLASSARVRRRVKSLGWRCAGVRRQSRQVPRTVNNNDSYRCLNFIVDLHKRVDDVYRVDTALIAY